VSRAADALHRLEIEFSQWSLGNRAVQHGLCAATHRALEKVVHGRRRLLQGNEPIAKAEILLLGLILV